MGENGGWVDGSGGRNTDLESLEPLVEPAYWAVSVKPSITTLTSMEATQTKQCQCRAFHKWIKDACRLMALQNQRLC